ncbi:hypothetical protein QBC42DRAFT_197941, partial [Cladorrhinum samala]
MIAFLPGLATLMAVYAGYILHNSFHVATIESETPYTFYGVTISSSTSEINQVATTYMADHQSSPAQLAKAACYYDILINPYLRCEYHRKNAIPDWYGIPDRVICAGEYAVLKAKLRPNKEEVQRAIDRISDDFSKAIGRI